MNPVFEAAGLVVFERGWLSSNNVLFAGSPDHPATLVDSGYSSHARQTLALVRSALGERPLERVINTHLHSDHCGGNHVLQEAYGCAIEVPIGEVDKVDRWDEELLTYRATGQHCPRFRRTGAVRDGDLVQLGAYLWKVIAAPGHDPESIVLYQPEHECLISADALWENGFGVVFPELEGISAFGDVRATLERVAALPIRWVIPGHGAPFQDAEAALARAFRRLDGLEADPERHALHAAKVLIKFHLLEKRQMKKDDLRRWQEATPYLPLVHGRYFAAEDFGAWCSRLVDALETAKAISVDGDWVRDR